MPTFAQSITFRDAKGQTATTSFYVAGADQAAAAVTAATIVAAAAALSNAAVQTVKGPSNQSPRDLIYGTNAEHQDIEDKAVFVFETSAGSVHRYSIPAPKASVFLADGETVDFTGADVATYVTAMLAGGLVLSRDNGPLAIAVGGGISRTKTRRKFSVITRNPTLSGQGL